ncbi:MAG: flagellar hook-length control protein FliK [Hyphomicrobiales bacterium]|nr:flagellar hook-length control protein FliK [Hyphomicrobiales bacterium]
MTEAVKNQAGRGGLRAQTFFPRLGAGKPASPFAETLARAAEAKPAAVAGGAKVVNAAIENQPAPERVDACAARADMELAHRPADQPAPRSAPPPLEAPPALPEAPPPPDQRDAPRDAPAPERPERAADPLPLLMWLRPADAPTPADAPDDPGGERKLDPDAAAQKPPPSTSTTPAVAVLPAAALAGSPTPPQSASPPVVALVHPPAEAKREASGALRAPEPTHIETRTHLPPAVPRVGDPTPRPPQDAPLAAASPEREQPPALQPERRAEASAAPPARDDKPADAAPAVRTAPAPTSPPATFIAPAGAQIAIAVMEAAAPAPRELAVARPSTPDAPEPVKTLRIELKPADLGAVTVTMTARGGALRVAITAERETTARTIADDRGALAELLAAAGRDVEAITVSADGAFVEAPPPIDGRADGGSGRAESDTGRRRDDEREPRPQCEGRAREDRPPPRDPERAAPRGRYV